MTTPTDDSELETELDRILDDYRIDRRTSEMAGEIDKAIAEAKEQLKQLILKEKLKAVLEVLPEKMVFNDPELAIYNKDFTDGYNSAVDETEQSARKRYQ